MTSDEVKAMIDAACDAAWSDANHEYGPLAMWDLACEACAKACEQKWEMGYRGDVVDGFANTCRALKWPDK